MNKKWWSLDSIMYKIAWKKCWNNCLHWLRGWFGSRKECCRKEYAKSPPSYHVALNVQPFLPSFFSYREIKRNRKFSLKYCWQFEEFLQWKINTNVCKISATWQVTYHCSFRVGFVFFFSTLCILLRAIGNVVLSLLWRDRPRKHSWMFFSIKSP